MNNTNASQLRTALDDPVVNTAMGLLSASLGSSGETFALDLNLWPEIKKELELQAVLPLVSVAKTTPALPYQEKTELLFKMASNINHFHKLMQAQSEVISLLNDDNIPAVIVKGAAAAQYYEKPGLRMYGDIDIIVSPDDFKKSFDLLCNAGYQNLRLYDDSNDRHIGFVAPDGMEIELHRYFSSSDNESENDIFDTWIYENIKNIEHIHLDRYEVPVFPALENGLILLGHMNQHLSDGLGLRQIIDWMLYVRAELTDEFWKEKFKARAEAIGMDCLAVNVTRMCQKYLGLSNEITWCKDADEELTDELMLYILNNGNFGRKTNTVLHRSSSVVCQLSSPAKAFSYLTKTGSIHMAEAGLKPGKSYAWLYQIGHLFLKFIKTGNKSAVVKGIECSAQQTALMKRLHVTRI